jgi:hypothetical protein
MESLPVPREPQLPQPAEHAPPEVHVSFWQKPFAQRVMPPLSSVFLHLIILCVGLIFFNVVRIVRTPGKTQITIPDASLSDAAAGGNMHPGVNSNDARDAAQDQVPNVDATGSATKRPNDLAATLETPGAVPQGASASAISSLQKASEAAGTGGENGPRGPYGVPGGGSALGTHASFLGVGGNGKRIVFIIDATGSMSGNSDAVCDRVSDAIDVLRPPQGFNIFFINDHDIPPPAPKMMFVNPESKRVAKAYIRKVPFRGGTDPLPALRRAFAMQPDLIYFLIDPGDFPDKQAVLDLVRQKASGGRTTMNIIAFEHHDEENEKFLKQLAEETHGVFAFKTIREMQEAK